MRTTYRYVLPVEDGLHDVELSGPIVHVGPGGPDRIEFWALVNDSEPTVRTFQVVHTGDPVPADAEHVGSAVTPDGAFVWHLFERPRDAS